jgi:hypothetical protein
MARSPTPCRSAIPAIDTPRLRRLTILVSRSALRCRAALRAAAERSRRGADGLGSDKQAVSAIAMENKYRIQPAALARNCRFF